MKKILVVLFSMFIICFSMSSFTSGDRVNFDVSLYSTSTVSPTLKNKTEEQVLLDMSSRYPESRGKVKLQEVTNLSDMNETYYKLAVFYPTGYTIYTEDFSLILEISFEATSPYQNSEGELIYLGAFNYFSRAKNILRRGVDESSHTMQGYSVPLNNNAINEISEIALELNNKVVTSKSSTDSRLRSLPSEEVSVRNPNIIKNASTAGFNSNGNCGYVAAALIVYYASRSWGWNYLYNQTNISNGLVREIQNGRGDSSWAPDLEGALNSYLIRKGATHSHRVNMWHIPNNMSFFDRVKEDKPVILLGNLPSSGTGKKSGHAVVVYNVKRNYQTYLFGIREYSNYIFTVHWGWDSSRNSIQLSEYAISKGGLVNLHR